MTRRGPYMYGDVVVVTRARRVWGVLRQLVGGRSWSLVLLTQLHDEQPDGAA